MYRFSVDAAISKLGTEYLMILPKQGIYKSVKTVVEFKPYMSSIIDIFSSENITSWAQDYLSTIEDIWNSVILKHDISSALTPDVFIWGVLGVHSGGYY